MARRRAPFLPAAALAATALAAFLLAAAGAALAAFAPAPARAGLRPPPRAWLVGRRAQAAVEVEAPARSTVLPELLAAAEAAAAAGGGFTELRARVDEAFDSIGPEDVSELQDRINGAGGAPQAGSALAELGAAIQASAEKRMGRASKLIGELIDNADGDINIGIRRCLKQEGNPMPLLMVLQLNIAQAQQEGETDKMRALMHIYTVMNEELEKKASRVNALLSKLMRLEDPGIRANLLRHHLTPVEVSAATDMDTGSPPLMAALVSPQKLAEGFAALVRNVDRQMRVAVGEYDEARFESLERIRAVAKEARAIIGELYGERPMNDFGAELAAPFASLMAHRAMNQPSPPPAEAAAAPTGGQDTPAAAAR